MTRGKKNERAASAVEYSLKVALVGMALILGLQLLVVSVGGFLDNCAVPFLAKGYVDESAGESCG